MFTFLGSFIMGAIYLLMALKSAPDNSGLAVASGMVAIVSCAMALEVIIKRQEGDSNKKSKIFCFVLSLIAGIIWAIAAGISLLASDNDYAISVALAAAAISMLIIAFHEGVEIWG